MRYSGFALLAGLLVAVACPPGAIAADATPTVAEVQAAFSGYVLNRKTQRGYAQAFNFQPDGKIERITVLPGGGRDTAGGKWWVAADSSLCVEYLVQGRPASRCVKTFKQGQTVYYLTSQGERVTARIPAGR